MRGFSFPSFRRRPALGTLAAGFFVVLAIVLGVGTVRAQSQERAAGGVVGELASGDFDAVVANFNDRLQREMPAGKVAQLWQSYLNQYGYYQSQLGSASNGGVVIIRCRMQKGAIDIRFVYEGNGRIAQFGINPIDTSVNIKPPT